MLTKNDCLPYIACQFGAVKFPGDDNTSDTLRFRPEEVRKESLRLTKRIRERNNG